MRHAEPNPDQGALFTPGPTQEAVRHAGDPHVFLPAQPRPTQVEAAGRALPRSGSQRSKVLAAIQASYDLGMTDEEIGIRLGLDGNSVRPRRKELEDAGLIVDSGEKRPTASSTKAIVWVAAEVMAP